MAFVDSIDDGFAPGLSMEEPRYASRKRGGFRIETAKLNDDSVRELHARATDGESAPSLAKRYRVTTQTVHDILARVSWVHLDLPVVDISQRGSRHANAKLTEDMIRRAHQQVVDAASFPSVAKTLKVKEKALMDAVQGRTWKHLGLRKIEGLLKRNGRKPKASH